VNLIIDSSLILVKIFTRIQFLWWGLRLSEIKKGVIVGTWTNIPLLIAMY